MTRRDPDPDRPGTVYRARPKLRRGDGWRVSPGGLREDTHSPDVRGDGLGARDADLYDAYGHDADPGREYTPATRRQPTSPTPSRRSSPPPSAPPTRRRRRLHLRLIVTLVVLALVAYPVALGLTAWRHVDRVEAVASAHAVSDPADQPGRTYLVVGSDERDDLTAEEKKRLGTGSVAGKRTDTIMILHVPSGGGPTVLVSVPRDSYVAIPGHGKNKINAAFAFGGPSLLIRTVEAATGVRIDDYVQTGLSGFAGIVDAIGGVRICPKFDMNDPKAHINLRKGCQMADGPIALGYARARYSDPRSDLGRVERQREVLAAIASKTLSPGVLAQPWRAFPAASAGGDALTIDEESSPISLGRFVLAMRAVSGGDGVTLTVPVRTANLSTGAGVAVAWDTAKAKTLFTAISTDDTEAVRPIAAEQEAALK